MKVHREGPFFTLLTHSQFPLGIIVLMPWVEFRLTHETVGEALYNHAMGYWGQVDIDLERANDEALESGGPVTSLFTSEPFKIPFRIITDGDRRNTYVMLESEYPDFEVGWVGPLSGDEG